MKGKGLFLYAIFFLLLFSCKKDSDSPVADCDTNNKPEFKRTEYTLAAPKHFPPFPENTILTQEIVNLGRHLFYEKRLSGDGTQACAGCHNQANAFSDNGKQFSEGIDGKVGDVNAMNTFNLNWGNGFFWDGRSATLEAQAIEPVINPIEMHNTWKNAINTLKGDTFYVNRFFEAFGTDDWDSTHAAIAISQFEKTLLSSSSKFDQSIHVVGGRIIIDQRLLGEAAYRGYQIFIRDPKSLTGLPGGDCNHCHKVENMLFTDNKFQNNGLDLNPDKGLAKVTGNTNDIGKFKTLTLRNIEKTGPYMHDGRFKTLEEVVEFYNSGVEASSPNISAFMDDRGSGIAKGLNLTTNEKNDLIAFLKTLTDTKFLTNPDFSDPNK